MKKLIALTLTFVLAFALTACGAGVADVFVNTFKGGSYHMKAKIIGGGTETPMESYVKTGMTAATMEAQGQTIRMIMRDNKTHMINDAEKTVMVMPTQPGLGNTPEVNVNSMSYIGNGTADFHGKNLPYDEYIQDVGGTTQFFVDGNKLAGMRNINGGVVADVVILEFDQNVPDSVFEIPAGYTQMSF